jgi:tetratricopeptide (TPR) repeat protein
MKLFLAAALAAAMTLTATAEDDAAEQFGKALEKETNHRDPSGAMEIYKKIVEAHRADEELAAKAQYRIGECLEKLGRTEEARAAYEAVEREYPGEAATIEKARERLAGLGGKAQPKEDEAAEVTLKLASTKLDLDFTDATLYDIVDFVREFAKVNILIDPGVSERAEKRISFNVRNLALDKALNLVGASSELEVVNRKGVLFFTSQERAGRIKDTPDVSLAANADDADRKVLASARSIRISLNFTATPLSETASFISAVSGLNVVVAENARDIPITMKFEDQSLARVMDVLQLFAEVDISIRDGSYFIKKHE